MFLPGLKISVAQGKVLASPGVATPLFQFAQTFNLLLGGSPQPPTLHPWSACVIGIASKKLFKMAGKSAASYPFNSLCMGRL